MRAKIKFLEEQIEELQKELEFLKSQVLFEELDSYTVGEIEDTYADWCFI